MILQDIALTNFSAQSKHAKRARGFSIAWSRLFEDISKSDVGKTTKNSASGPGAAPGPPSPKIIQIGREVIEKSSKNHPFLFYIKKKRKGLDSWRSFNMKWKT